jgi:hypothetical protein
MPYIQRDPNGIVISLKRESDLEHTEFLPPTHSEIVDFLTSASAPSTAKDTLSESDQDFARATEDLIHLLIEKNMILFTELPPEVQAKMAGREKLRSNLGDSPYNFLDNGESI